MYPANTTETTEARVNEPVSCQKCPMIAMAQAATSRLNTFILVVSILLLVWSLFSLIQNPMQASNVNIMEVIAIIKFEVAVSMFPLAIINFWLMLQLDKHK